ncbi:hypothetical protein GCM10009609_43860 [Pseudonocardia aurantiaca]|uniref:DEAD/DEAH box helicase n=1 Tax=Pseudonocardia aurantiaca TaxID=75290 RepID=A0ABW4G094_9PSEU
MAVYQSNGGGEDLAALRGLAEEQLPTLAGKVLGSPPAMRHMDVLIDPLRSGWLPQLDNQRLDELVNHVQHNLTGDARDVRLRTKQQRIAFVRERRKTHNLKLLVRNAFVSAHRRWLPAQTIAAPPVPADSAQWTLLGEGRRDTNDAYPHQLQAWTSLDRMARARRAADRSGLLVLPTGAGKTYTLVRWLLERMDEDRELTVLWIADRQELVEQAAFSFAKVAASRPRGFSRTLRRIHNGASPATTLADEDLDVAIVTRQSLRGRLDEAAKKRLRRFFGARPAVVVVDEAHHAVAPTYEDLLDYIQQVTDPLLVGLTATPWPSGYGATERLRKRFPQTIATAEVGELIRSGVLARPVHHTVETGEHVELSEAERRQLGGPDLPASVLRRFDNERRNEAVVQAWLDRPAEWGKTLVFAVDIEHADRLSARFRERDVNALVVHSRAEMSRVDVLKQFRAATGPTVLVSVGMLTEGVDLPDARTAILARPTTSRILLRQMIGRVLRGPLSGGDPAAHIVDMRDHWDDDVDVLAPVEIPMDGEQEGESLPGERPHLLPRVIDELTGGPVSEDVLYRVLRGYRERIRGQSGLPAMTSATLVGFFRLDDLSPPVFDHTRSRYDELIRAELHGKPLGVRGPLDLFDDLPVPRPLRRDVEAVVDFIRAQRIEPPFEPLRAVFSVRALARELGAQPMTPSEQSDWLRKRFESSLARSMFPGFHAFYEAVHQELFSLGLPDAHGRFNPEDPRRRSGASRPQAKLRHSDRDLGELLGRVKAHARSLLAADDPHYLDLLATPLQVDWTRNPTNTVFAYWAPRISGPRRGTPQIWVNRLLSAPQTQIPDENLEYLLWHEVLHHLLPRQGHDAEFRRLEAMWPNSEQHDHFLDTLAERYDLSAAG